MGINLQQLIDNCASNDIIHLPVGEFEGPFYIRKPCSIMGNFTTLWTKKGPALFVNSKGVTIKDIRVEITDPEASGNDFICLASNSADTHFSNVEIIGNVKGIAGEESGWDIPKLVALGQFPAETDASFLIEVTVPVEVALKSTIKDVNVSPEKLSAGKNVVTISTGKLRDNTFLYGELIFESSFTRMTYLSGCAKSNVVNYSDNSLVYKTKICENNINFQQGNLASAPNPKVKNPVVADPDTMILDRGQRISIKDIIGYDMKLNFIYTDMLHNMDIDPYIFMINKDGKTVSDDNLIFFGNKSSICGGVRYLEDENKAIAIDLNKVPEKIQTIAIAYSIYGDNPSHNFSHVINPSILVLSSKKQKLSFSPEDLFMERTLVMIEFYRHNGEWKLKTVGAGYKDGLKRLCESYGLVVL